MAFQGKKKRPHGPHARVCGMAVTWLLTPRWTLPPVQSIETKCPELQDKSIVSQKQPGRSLLQDVSWGLYHWNTLEKPCGFGVGNSPLSASSCLYQNFRYITWNIPSTISRICKTSILGAGCMELWLQDGSIGGANFAVTFRIIQLWLGSTMIYQ